MPPRATARRYAIWPDPRSAHGRFVREALDAAGWRAATDPGAGRDLLWSTRMPRVADFRRLGAGAQINHFPAITAITRKDTLYWALCAARLGVPRAVAAAYRFFPATYVLPDDHAAFLAAAARAPRALWIAKPCAESCGRGIAMVRDPRAVPARAGRLVQRYLDAPHLLDGFKYTLRCYVAVTGFDPLEVWLFDDGFAKLTSRPYTRARTALGDRFVHLTNPDVQRLNAEVPTSARNLTHAQYRARMRAAGADVDALFATVGQIAAATVRAARPFVLERAAEVLPARAGRPFELLGLDVLVDRALKPWLIECNLCPSLAVEADATTASARAEHDIKRRVVRDLLVLGGVLPGRRGDGDVVGGFRRVMPAANTLHLADA